MALTKITSNIITDGAITTDDLATTTIASISGSGNQSSSSLASRVTVTEASSSNINQNVKSSASPTFAGGTITGDFSVGGILTAQEFHTEFESASITYTSGSNKFGDSSDDVHSMTGSLNISGSLSVVNDSTTIERVGGSPKLILKNSSSDAKAFIQADHDDIQLGFTSAGTPVDSVKLFVSSSGKVGIGTDNPSSLLDVFDSNGVGLRFGDVSSTPSVTAGLIGMSTSGYSGNNGDLVLMPRTSATSKILLMEGNVGIGNTSPAAKLDVQGSAIVGRNRDIGSYASDDFDLMVTNANNDATAILLYNDAGAYQSGLIEYYNNKLSLGLNNANTDDDLLTTTAINITSTGVGIGTASPSNQLHIFSSAGGVDTILRIECDASNASPSLFLDAATDRDSGIQFRENNSLKAQIYNDASNDALVLTDGANSGLMHLKGGNVGINEDAPITKLDVRLDSSSTDLTNDYAMFINNQTGASSGRHATIGFGTYNNGGLTNVFGAVAEGTGAQSGFAFLTHNGGSLTEKVRIANGGNVGIGTTTPSEKLQVYDGDILVSSGRGVRANGGQEMIRFNSSNGVQVNSGNAERVRFKRDGSIMHNGTGTNVGMELYKHTSGSSANLLFTVTLNDASSLYHLVVCEIIIAHIGNANPRLISQYIWEIENHSGYSSPSIQTPINLGGDDQSITVGSPSENVATFQINGQGGSTTNIGAYFRVVSGVTGVSSLT